MIPKYRELRISETPDGGVMVDFFPDGYVQLVAEKEPTESNPEVKVDLAKLGGGIVPVHAYYPKGTTTEEIMGKVDTLFEKVSFCPNCERRKRIMLEKLKRHLESQGKGEVFDKVMSQMAVKKEAEAQREQQQRQEKMQWQAEQAIKPKKPPLEERMKQNVGQAFDDVYVAIRNFVVPPVPPIRPDAWLEEVGVRRRTTSK